MIARLKRISSLVLIIFLLSGAFYGCDKPVESKPKWNIPQIPYPNDGAEKVDTNTTLRWSVPEAQNKPLTYNVYFASHSSLEENDIVAFGLSREMYDPSESLLLNSTYYWKVVATDSLGNNHQGPEWSFTIKNQNDKISLLQNISYLNEEILDIAIRDSLMFLITDRDIFYVIDISDPLNPNIIDYLLIPDMRALQVSGNYVYILDQGCIAISQEHNYAYLYQGNRLDIISVETPQNPQFVSTLHLSPYNYDTEGIVIINIANPGNPIYMGNIDQLGQNTNAFISAVNCSGIFIDERYIYILHRLGYYAPHYIHDGLWITNILGSPHRLEADYRLDGEPECGLLTNEFLYMGLSRGNILKLNVMYPSNIQVVSEATLSANHLEDIVVDSQYVYIACASGGFQVLTQYFEPWAAYNALPGARKIQTVGNYIFVLDWNYGVFAFISQP